MAETEELNGTREGCRPVLEAQVRRWSQIPWEQLPGLLQDSQAYEVTFGTKKYQVEVALLDDTDAHIHFSVAVDDGVLPRAMLPLSQSVVLSKTRHERRKMVR
jgi:hypothetical protein